MSHEACSTTARRQAVARHKRDGHSIGPVRPGQTVLAAHRAHPSAATVLALGSIECADSLREGSTSSGSTSPNASAGAVGVRGAGEALMFGIMVSFAEFELHLIRKRQAEGIARAKAKVKGTYPRASTLGAADVAQA